MKLDNKGVSLVGLVITIIVIVIIAGIALSSGFINIDKAQQATFLSDLENVNDAINIYNERADIYGKKDYDKRKLSWNGQDKYLTNSAKINYLTNDTEGKKINPQYTTEEELQKIYNAQEDTADFLFNGVVPTSLRGKIYIVSGKVYVYRSYKEEFEWATSKYEYIGNSVFETIEEFVG